MFGHGQPAGSRLGMDASCAERVTSDKMMIPVGRNMMVQLHHRCFLEWNQLWRYYNCNILEIQIDADMQIS